MYNAQSDTWINISPIPISKRYDLPSFVINNKTYIGTGDCSQGICKDLWEYTPPSILATVSPSTTVCIGTIVTLTASGGSDYSWNTGETVNTIIVSPSSTTTYSVTVTGFCNSSDATATVSVVNYSIAYFDFEYDPCKKRCIDFTNKSINALTWKWDYGDGQNSTAWNECHLCSDSSLYNISLLINESSNCADTFNMQISYVTHDTSPFVYIPNAFSPNNDGINDVLSFFKKDAYCINDFELKIYTCWEELVFMTKDINDFWNGTVNGKTIDDGIFTYYCKTITRTGKKN